MEVIRGREEIGVKKYAVRWSAAERTQLDELISKGKRSAQLLTKELGEGWSDPDCRGPGASSGANTIPLPPDRGFSTA
jgi:hypothetical protein